MVSLHSFPSAEINSIKIAEWPGWAAPLSPPCIRLTRGIRFQFGFKAPLEEVGRGSGHLKDSGQPVADQHPDGNRPRHGNQRRQ